MLLRILKTFFQEDVTLTVDARLKAAEAKLTKIPSFQPTFGRYASVKPFLSTSFHYIYK